jgi:hypothetical protein
MQKPGYTLAALVIVFVLVHAIAAMGGLATEGLDGGWYGTIYTGGGAHVCNMHLAVHKGRYIASGCPGACQYRWTLMEETEGSAAFHAVPIDHPHRCGGDTWVEIFRMAANRLQMITYNAYYSVAIHGKLRCHPCAEGTVGGWTTQLTPSKIICRNVTRHQSVVITDEAATWNCEDSGLVVRPGDTIRQTITGTAR